jgi:hypothetical protein
MTTPPSFPALPGQGWSVHKRPTFSTRVASHVSGREVRSPFYAYTLYEFELTFDALVSDLSRPGLGSWSMQNLMGFYLQCQGQYGTFLYTDLSDNSVVGQGIGIGDGATTSFLFQRSLGGFLEPVSWVASIEAVYLNGVAQASGWSLAAPNVLSFATAPAVDAIITSDFSYAFVCRFLDDQEDFENFMVALWKVESVKFRSVKP